MSKEKAKSYKVEVEMPIGLIKSLRYLSTQKDSKGKIHSFSEIVVGACNLYLMGIQAYADTKKDKSKMEEMKNKNLLESKKLAGVIDNDAKRIMNERANMELKHKENEDKINNKHVEEMRKLQVEDEKNKRDYLIKEGEIKAKHAEIEKDKVIGVRTQGKDIRSFGHRHRVLRVKT